MSAWAEGSFFYHIYPLGLCGAPERNDFVSAPEPRLERLVPWLSHARSLGANALYLGPVFESSKHGYDTADYFTVDRRLGTNATLAKVCGAARDLGFRVILDAVLNHVGRDFRAFKDVREKGRGSAYADWFSGIDFKRKSPLGDPFAYEGWAGHYDLVKLEVRNPAVQDHLFSAVTRWVEEFGIDGLRLDAADCLDLDFLRRLASLGRRLRPDFWLLGEIVGGDYRTWAGPGMLDSVTNYECYKGLYSSHVDANYFEIAWSLNRQSGASGLYRDLLLYNFVDNHDVGRVASMLKDPADLVPLYSILFTMPGIPSLYYGSEWGIAGVKAGNDSALRPALDLRTAAAESPHPELAETIRSLAGVRASSPALRAGDYTQLAVTSRQLAYMRRCPEQSIIVVVSSAADPVEIDLPVPTAPGGRCVDALQPAAFDIRAGRVRVRVPAHGARILSVEAY
jgi:cyclomaltodextrinase / maltogenic alpha-amylase / neopullulanase